MKKRLIAPMLLSAASLAFFTITGSAQAATYTDYSIYKVEPAKTFSTESQASQAAAKLEKDTGWDASYQASGTTTTYQITATGIHSEAQAKTVLSGLTKQTAITGTSSPVGSKQPYMTITSGAIPSEKQANTLLAKLKQETGVSGAVKMSGTAQFYMNVVTSEIADEMKVKELIQGLTKKTGIKSTYQPVTHEVSVTSIQSGAIIGDSKAAQVKNTFQKESGLKASLKETAKGQAYYTFTTASISGEANAKTLLQQLKQSTGITGSYKSINQKTTADVYNVQSAYFRGLNTVKDAISQIKKNTGVSGYYQKVGKSTSYTVNMKNLTKQQLQKVDAFFKKKKWHYTSSAVKKTATSSAYQITTAQILGEQQANKAAAFFTQKKVKATKKATGKTAENQYQLISEETTDQAKVTKGLNVLKKNKLSAAAKTVKKQTANTFKITTESLLDAAKVNEAITFFKSNQISAASKKTGQTAGSKYQITTEAIISQEDIDRVLAFFKKNNASGTAAKTGATAYTQYKILTSQLSSKTALNNGLNYFKAQQLSANYTTKSNTLYKISLNEQFTGNSAASAASAKLKQLYGWTSSTVKIKNGPQIMKTNYNLSLRDMVQKQMKVSPQTDGAAYVSLAYINTATSTVTADVLNIRSTPAVSPTNVIGQLKKGDKVKIIGQTNGWAKINMGWRNASSDEVGQYVDPNNFSKDSKYYFQFLKLSQTAGLSVAEVNQKVLAGKGILTGKAKAFIDAATKYSINELYLISHALLETGNGTSDLANGLTYNGRTVYNMYGIGAYDSNPNYYGAKYAYEQGWFTPEAAIIGGAKFIGSSYIHNTAYNQDTLYKMRWSATAAHQYATDIGWAYKQVNRMYSLYSLLDGYTLYYDVPEYQ
ncbi:glucosaminidase domain-containing protein [Bacillus halotolerans]|uniref:glucosaminidase domain-containing protein n=1 Tax=Bacillus halotolerans TaxID=260554 RepID=UPI00273AA2AD|nr:glucosaminidase domain-containing protein [Bacillus halotolerans]MDP4524801.1 glucosaminidase domain-containing protein [Bacillus halotolerans]